MGRIGKLMDVLRRHIPRRVPKWHETEPEPVPSSYTQEEIQALEAWVSEMRYDGRVMPVVPDEELIRRLKQMDYLHIYDSRGYTPLMMAADGGRTEIVRWLVKHGVDVNVQAPNGYTALHFAVAMVAEDTIRLLLDAGADPTLPDATGSSVLMCLPPKTHSELGRLLIEYGADPYMKAEGRMSYIDMLIRSGRQADFPEYFTAEGEKS